MGMYDNVTCKYPLPNPEAQDICFQTKDLECFMNQFEITEAGRLILHEWDREETPLEERLYPEKHPWIGMIRAVKVSHRTIDQDFHGVLNFYGNSQTGELRILNLKTGEDEAHPGPEPEWFEYNAKFTDGQLVIIERVYR